MRIGKTVKRILLTGIIALLFSPLFGELLCYFRLVQFNPLHGVYQPTEMPVMSIGHFFSAEWQKQFELYLHANSLFRRILVRIDNQISFSLFTMSSAANVVVGKEGFLFEDWYIKEFYGRNSRGEDYWKEQFRKIRYVHDALHDRGVELIIMLAPGKARYYREYIPDRFKPLQNTMSNYKCILKQLEKEEINFIDLNSYFVTIKDTSTYPLFPKCGIHWSATGAGIAMDTIIHRMEAIKKCEMADLGWSGYDLPDTLRSPDYDLGDLMNLMFRIPHDNMAYPKFHFHSDTSVFRPRVITIADSYYWNLYSPGISTMIYGKDTFWNYFSTAYEPVEQLVVSNGRINTGLEIFEGRIKQYDLKNIDILEQIFTSDFILVMTSESNYYRLGFGFFETVYDLLHEKTKHNAS
jgi:hypothetical protein